MAREEELKRIDLKVNVSCCEGCRRKVMKAISLKGVLRTEIQPSQDRVTVVGDVDARVLVKKLSKVGKIAEVLPPPLAPSSDNDKRREEGSGDKPAAPAEEEKSSKSKDDGKGAGADKAAAACEEECKKCTQKAARDRGDDVGSGDVHHAGGKDASGKDGGDADGFGGKASLAPAPQVVQMQQHFHRAEPPMVVPVHVPAAYYPPAPAPAPYYGGYYAMPPPPMPMPMPMGACRRQLRPQPSRFDEDYFNDDNTVGCRVM
ncbi:unnamed protein product [Urochloa humidicola]